MDVTTLSYSDATGWSDEIDPSSDSDSTLVLAFGAQRFGHDPRPFAELRDRLPRAHMIGCSTAGEIHQTKVSDDTVSVAIVRFERTRLSSASASINKPDDSFSAGISIGRQLVAPDLAGILVLSSGDGIGVNGSHLVAGINEIIGGRAIVTGGLAGDGSRFETTWVIDGRAPRYGVVVAVGIYGTHVRLGHGSRGGWDIFGPERIVTRSHGNVLYELDGRPALGLYKEYLGERAAGLPATGLLFPLALRANDATDRRLVRTILGIDEANQSLTFAGDIAQGALAQLMRANFDRLVQGASDAAAMTSPTEVAGDRLAIAISCVGRRLLLGERVEEETEAVSEALPAGTKQIGFYSYGEISPYSNGLCDLHNQTMTLTTIGELD